MCMGEITAGMRVERGPRHPRNLSGPGGPYSWPTLRVHKPEALSRGPICDECHGGQCADLEQVLEFDSNTDVARSA
jgi:hypothetical protein